MESKSVRLQVRVWPLSGSSAVKTKVGLLFSSGWTVTLAPASEPLYWITGGVLAGGEVAEVVAVRLSDQAPLPSELSARTCTK